MTTVAFPETDHTFASFTFCLAATIPAILEVFVLNYRAEIALKKGKSVN